MTKRLQIQLVKVFCLAIMLQNCTTPVGDMGRIDASVTQATPFNYLSFSKLEQKFRTSALLLRNMGYDIAITDHFFIESIDHTKLPIKKEAIVNSFITSSIFDIEDRFKSLNANIDDRLINFDLFYTDASNVMREASVRDNIQNAALNVTYQKQVQLKHKESIRLIRDMVFFLNKLVIAYNYVVDQGQLVEPRISTYKLKTKIRTLKGKIGTLNTLIR